MRSATKKRLARLEQQTRTETVYITIKWVDQDGNVVAVTPPRSVKRRSAYEVPYVDYREIFRGGIYADYEKQT